MQAQISSMEDSYLWILDLVGAPWLCLAYFLLYESHLFQDESLTFKFPASLAAGTQTSDAASSNQRDFYGRPWQEWCPALQSDSQNSDLRHGIPEWVASEFAVTRQVSMAMSPPDPIRKLTLDIIPG